MRIISLIPSSTEIVCALGFQDQLVGRSHECDFPKGVDRLPVCSEPKFNPNEGSSRDIHNQVTDIVQDSLSVYRVHKDRLKELQPDVIITQAQCEVCAVSIKDVECAVNDWIGTKPQIVSLEPNSLEDLWKGIQQVAQALGNPQKGNELVQQYKERMAEISAKAQALKKLPSVATIEWMDPLMTAGNWVPEFIDMLGGINLFGEPGKHSPRLTWEDLRRNDPDVIVGMPCGWGMERCRKEMEIVAKNPGWNELNAVKTKRVYCTDGNQYFNRPGPRLVESLEILAEVMYPDDINYGHQGTGWQEF